jgi:hypothetical protein
VDHIGDYIQPKAYDAAQKEILFELKVHNLTAASPGSVTATGRYVPIDRSPLVPIPSWLVEWVAEHGFTTTKKQAKGRPQGLGRL